MLCLLLGLGLAACCAPLHALICPDAGQPDDFCVIKQFQSGLAEAPLTQAVFVALTPVLVIASSQGEEWHAASPLFRLSPSRAPPFGFALS